MLTLAEVVSTFLAEGTYPENWSQGRTAYGGLLAAAGMAALREQVPLEKKARSFFVQFLGPLAPTERAEVDAVILSSGKSMTVGQITVSSQGQPRFRQLVTYAGPRVSSIKVDAQEQVPDWPEPASLPVLPFLPVVVPNFTQAFDYRWAEGEFPFSGSTRSDFGGYFSIRGEAGPPEVATAGMLDAWPPAVLPLLRGPAPASTVNWSVHLFDLPEIGPGQWYRYRAHTVAAADGTATTRALLWAPEGRLMAVSEQLVAVYG